MLRSAGLRSSFRPRATHLVRNWTSVTTTKDSLVVDTLGKTAFPYVWLRDSCQGPESIHPSTRQKLHRTSDIPLDVCPKALLVGETFNPNDAPTRSVQILPDGLKITWNDGHVSSYTSEFLSTHSASEKLQKFHYSDYTSPSTWTSATITQSPNLYINYGSLNDPKGLVEAMTQLLKYGLIFVSGVPTEHKANDACELKTLAEKFGEIRNTFYGELWDVINIQNSKNIAYTNLDLGLHMDLLSVFHFSRQSRY